MKQENSQALLSKYARRLSTEGWLKAFLLSLTIGFGLAMEVATVFWFMKINAIWISLAIIVGVTALGTVIFYYAKFRPTLKNNAKRIDRLGLEERTITMVEFENDDSIISRLQREDARAYLATINEKMLKMRVPKALVIVLSAAAAFCCLTVTLSVLASLGYIMSGAELMEPLLPDDPVEYVYIEYIVEEGGYIEGEEFQEVILGTGAEEVMAVPEDGWIFVGWDDGFTEPARQDDGVERNMVLVAVFEPSGEEGNNDGEGEGEGEGEGNPSDQPGEGEGEGDSDSQDPNEATSGGGKYESSNQVVNGQTYYRDIFAQYEDQINEYLASGEEIPEEIRKIIETYLEIIG